MVLDTARIPPVTAGLGFTLQDQNQFQVFQHQGSTSSYLRQCSIDTAGSGLLVIDFKNSTNSHARNPNEHPSDYSTSAT